MACFMVMGGEYGKATAFESGSINTLFNSKETQCLLHDGYRVSCT